MFAILGNVVRHLHWIIVPRYRRDPRWEAPIWTTTIAEMPVTPMAAAERAGLIQKLRTAVSEAASFRRSNVSAMHLPCVAVSSAVSMLGEQRDQRADIEAKIVACLGSSSTAGKGQAFDCIDELARRPENARIVFRNLGVGGDFAYNALQRIPELLNCHPDKAVVWVGGNDVLAQVFPHVRRYFSILKRLPRVPNTTWFRECLLDLVMRLKTESSASIGLCSLAPFGEDPNSTDPCQAALTRWVAEYSAIAHEIALSEGCVYIPIYEELQARLLGQASKPFTAFRYLPFYRDAFRTVILREPLDEVGQKNGWRLHTDGVHLNRRGGLIAAGLIQRFLAA